MKKWFNNLGRLIGKKDKPIADNDEQHIQSSPEVSEADSTTDKQRKLLIKKKEKPIVDNDEVVKPAPEISEDNKTTVKLRKWLLIRKKKPWSLKKKIIFAIISVLSAIILVVAAFAISILTDPLGPFKTVVEQMTTPASTDTAQSQPIGTPTPSPTLDPYGQLIAQSDFSILKDTVNILLIGVDYAPERDTWGGKHAYHADVMIILAINTRTNDVNLISLPRDTYANIPGIKGIYKLNASINCGGGWPTDPGLQEVCKAASWMIGGLPIQYYYAVDMSAVKGLVDSIQGVDFNVDIAFKIQGRSYNAGMQHMDGQAVLDYLRIRKAATSSHGGIIDDSGETGDLNRINRQKNMLVAIFQKLKDSGIIFKLPDILGAFNGLKTNVPLANTAGLAAYAFNISSDKIKMYSMGGSSKNIFNWNFIITSEKQRKQIILDVYGVDIVKDKQIIKDKYGATVPSYKQYDLESATALWDSMQAQVILKKSRTVLNQVKSALDVDALLPPYPTPTPPPTPTETPAPTPADTSAPTPAPTETPTPTPVPTPIPSAGYQQYGSNVWDLYYKAEREYSQIYNWNREGVAGNNSIPTPPPLSTPSPTSPDAPVTLSALNTQLKTDIQILCSDFSIKVTNWTVFWHVNYEEAGKEPYSNEVTVDFR